MKKEYENINNMLNRHYEDLKANLEAKSKDFTRYSAKEVSAILDKMDEVLSIQRELLKISFDDKEN